MLQANNQTIIAQHWRVNGLDDVKNIDVKVHFAHHFFHTGSMQCQKGDQYAYIASL